MKAGDLIRCNLGNEVTMVDLDSTSLEKSLVGLVLEVNPEKHYRDSPDSWWIAIDILLADGRVESHYKRNWSVIK